MARSHWERSNQASSWAPRVLTPLQLQMLIFLVSDGMPTFPLSPSRASAKYSHRYHTPLALSHEWLNTSINLINNNSWLLTWDEVILQLVERYYKWIQITLIYYNTYLQSLFNSYITKVRKEYLKDDNKESAEKMWCENPSFRLLCKESRSSRDKLVNVIEER